MKRKLQLEQTLYLDYTRSALRILQRSLELARGAEPDFYRVAAVQLRLLLCDTTRQHERVVETALLPRLFPSMLLPALDDAGRPQSGQAGLPIPAWLEQTVPGLGISLRALIRRVCDQDGGAHVDLRDSPPLADSTLARAVLMAIGDVVLAEAGRSLFPRQ